MGNVVRFPTRRHARTSRVAGRGISEGHETSAGQRSENQTITSSYLRAVKVLPSSSKRSKKRQSPAASRPTVDKLTPRACAYVEAQAMRFDRSSVSMTDDDSRKIPTAQAKSVGNFRLAESSDTSDKSAMSSIDEVRRRIQQAFDRTGDSPITVALEWEFERNHIRDFLEGKKSSLKLEVLQLISKRYNIHLDDLTITRQKKKRKAA